MRACVIEESKEGEEYNMDVYRQKPLPVIYTRLDFVRAPSSVGIVADCPEDLARLRKLQSIVAGDICVSEIEWAYAFFVKLDIPRCIEKLDGTSDAVIQWRIFHWKVFDAESLVRDDHSPAEAVSLESAGIDTDFLDSLAHPTSCIPFLRQTETYFKGGYTLKPEIASAIKEIEDPLIAALKLRDMKGRIKPRRNQWQPKVAGTPQLPPKLRDRILRKNKYRCLFCGKGSLETELEVHHIIPRNLINKLHLDPALHTSPENLCVTCFNCNRGKSDSLAKEDIEYYLDAFSSPVHPNHDLLPYLRKISDLQKRST